MAHFLPGSRLSGLKDCETVSGSLVYNVYSDPGNTARSTEKSFLDLFMRIKYSEQERTGVFANLTESVYRARRLEDLRQ